MSKYIIEIAEEYEEYFKGVLICGIADGKFAVDVIAREDLEELNSDYINEHSDRIEVGDEVDWDGDCFIVTKIFQPRNMKEQCDGIDDDGSVYHDILMEDLKKTGKHYDIASILEAMRE